MPLLTVLVILTEGKFSVQSSLYLINKKGSFYKAALFLGVSVKINN